MLRFLKIQIQKKFRQLVKHLNKEIENRLIYEFCNGLGGKQSKVFVGKVGNH